MNRVINVIDLSEYRGLRHRSHGNLAVQMAEVIRIRPVRPVDAQPKSRRAFRLNLALGALIAAAVILMSGSAEASGAPDWLASRLVAKQGPRGTVRARSFQRWIATSDTAFSIGTVSYLDLPMDAAELARVPAILAEGMGIDRWQFQRLYRGARAYEALWPAANRVIRLYTRHRQGRAEISIAVFRAAYADTMVLETEALQRAALGILDGSRPWIERLLSRAYGALVPAAHAQDACGNCAPTDVACILAQLSCTSGGLLERIDSFSSTAQDLVTEASEFNDTARTLGAQINGNWRETNRQLETFNSHLAKANETAERMVDFLTSPVAAFVTAAAGTLGSMGANLAIEGLMLAGKELIDLITGASEEKEIRQRFARAREKWEQANQAVADLERMLDGLIALKGAAEKFQLTRESLVKVGPLLVRIDTAALISRSRLKKEMRRPDGSESCIEELSNNVASLESLAENLRSVNKQLKEAPAMPGEKKYCQSLNSLLDKLVMAEGELQSYRTAIIDGRAQVLWQEDWHDEEEKIRKSLTEVRGRAKKMRDERVAHLNERLTRTIAAEGIKESEWISSCEAKRRGMVKGVAIVDGGALFGGPSTEWSTSSPSAARQKCAGLYARTELAKESAAKVEDERARHASGVKAANEAYQAALASSNDQGGLLWMHDLAHDSYLKWMSALIEEQNGAGSRVQELDGKKRKIQEICAL